MKPANCKRMLFNYLFQFSKLSILFGNIRTRIYIATANCLDIYIKGLPGSYYDLQIDEQGKYCHQLQLTGN